MTSDEQQGLEFSSDIRVALDQFNTWAGGGDSGAVQEKFVTPPLEMPDGYELIMTCIACPEQYDLLDDTGQTIGYFRLRSGIYRVDAPECMDDTVYVHTWSDDEWKGAFDSQEERQHYLQLGVDAVLAYHTDEWQPIPGEFYRCATCRWWIKLDSAGNWTHDIPQYEPERVEGHEAHWEKGRHGL